MQSAPMLEPLPQRGLLQRVALLLSKQAAAGGDGGLQVLRLLGGADSSGDQALDTAELTALLRRVAPDASELEAQLLLALADTNGDGRLSAAELGAALAQAADIDALAERGRALPDAEKAVMAALPQLSSRVYQLQAALLQAKADDVAAAANQQPDSGRSAAEAVITFPQVAAALRSLLPSADALTLRTLLAHISRTALVPGPASSAQGLPLTQVLQALGVGSEAAGMHSSGGGGGVVAAVAAGWVPGRLRRDVWKLLRHHVKKNKAQVDELFPPQQQQQLSPAEVVRLVDVLLASRGGEPPLTRREADHIVALLDRDAGGSVSREEFDSVVRYARDLHAAMTSFSARPDAQLATDMLGRIIITCADNGCPTWGEFTTGCRELAQALAQSADW